MWNMYNRLKLPYFGLNARLLFTDLFRIRIQIRIQNVYFGFGSDPAKSFGSIRIRNTASVYHNTDGWMLVVRRKLTLIRRPSTEIQISGTDRKGLVRPWTELWVNLRSSWVCCAVIRWNNSVWCWKNQNRHTLWMYTNIPIFLDQGFYWTKCSLRLHHDIMYEVC